MGTDLNRVFLFAVPHTRVLTLVLTLAHKPAVIMFLRVLLTGGTRVRVFGSLSLDPRILSGIRWRVLNESRQRRFDDAFLKHTMFMIP
jgi:hypothetical protein